MTEAVTAGPAWIPAFLGALSRTGIVTKAVAAAGTSLTTVYDHRRRDPHFAEAFDAARGGAAPRRNAGKRDDATRPKPDWRRCFLARLAETSNVAAACKTAGVPAATVYQTRRRDPLFYRQWQEALAEGYDNLEMEMVRRLRVGETAKAPRKYDNAIAFRLLAAHREAVGRQKAARADQDEDTILAALNEKLGRMRSRELARAARERSARLAAKRGAQGEGAADEQ